MKAIYPDGSGGVFLADVPEPEAFDGAVRCRLTHSLISAGTERRMIEHAKGRTREDIVASGYRIGYSGVGIVEEVYGADTPFQVGQRVACYGSPYVSHAEVLTVPRHLAHVVPDPVESSHAVFIGLSAIAMHGFRKGKAGLGDVVFVGGVGIIGNLLVQQALLAGCRVVASDLEVDRLERLRRNVSSGADLITVKPDDAANAVHSLSDGRGADAVYPCMATASNEPFEQAIRAARPGGRVVVVGVLGMEIPRDPFFYGEVEITMSRAGGPGRYDPNYERHGFDYPVQYCRWTEGRNLEESLRLIATGKLRVSELIGHQYLLDRVAEAYRAVMAGGTDLGHLLLWK